MKSKIYNKPRNNKRRINRLIIAMKIQPFALVYTHGARDGYTHKGGDKKNYLKYAREVDIILGDNNGETWIEAKSKKVPLKNSELKPWTVSNSRGKGSIHKQFLSDLIALNPEALETPNIVVNDFSWRFHKFATHSGVRGPTNPTINSFKLRNKMCANPTGGNAAKYL